MANTELENIIGVTDKRFLQTAATVPEATPANYSSVSALRARLTAINAGYFTSARLDNMTRNDMVYAVRLNDDAAGI